MNRNQKIALGCGGAGCLGLIVVVIVGCLVYFLVYRSPARRRYEYNYNVSKNRNSNSNDNSDFSTNTNTNDNTNTNENDNSSNSNSSSSTSPSSMSDDDQHKLYYAAGMTGEGEVVRRVSVKLGLINDDFTPTGDKYEKFVADHVGWLMRNGDFVRSINTREKARAYVNEHFPE
jgi:hypothetical protein